MKFSYNASNKDASSLTKNPGKMLGKNQSLVFTYPFLIDKSVIKYSDIVRDFMTTQFIAEIKISNVLNIAGEASRAGAIETGNNTINPAEKLQNTLGSDVTNAKVLSDMNQYSRQEKTKFDYEYKIREFQDFIVDQVKHDPRYSDLRPVISSITVENLLTIPLIIGTKQYKLDTNFTYWFLYVAFGLNANLNSKSKFGNIVSVINEIPAEDYKQLIYQASNHNVSNIANKKLTSNIKVDDVKNYKESALNDILNETQSKLKKNIKVFERVLNENLWNEEVGVNRDDLNISTVSVEYQPALNQAHTNAISLFNSIFSSDIVRLFQSVANLLVSVADTNITSKVDTLSQDISGLVNSNMDQLKTSLYAGIRKETDEENMDYNSKLENIMRKSMSSCENNSKIDATNIFNNLRNISFSISSSDQDSFLKFIEQLNGLSNQLSPLINNIYNLMINISPGTENSIKSIVFGDSGLKAVIETNIVDFLIGRKDGNEPIINMQELNSMLENNIPEDFNPRFNQILGNRSINNDRQLKKYIKTLNEVVDNLKTAGSNVILFTALYTFLSYYCEYVQEIEAGIKAKQKDALAFPNYCLVVPSFFIERIYVAAAAKKFSLKVDGDKALENLAGANITENNLAKMINYLNNQLKIPNIMVIDDKKNTVYYKWMYMPAAMQTDMNSLKTYVQHQSEVLPGF